MRSNRLQLNGEKTEVMWCSSTRRLSQLPNSSIVVAGANVHPVSTVRDLGVYTDSDLGAATHIRKTVSCCFAALRQLRHLRRYVTYDCFRSLVVLLIHSTLDYGNFVLVGLRCDVGLEEGEYRENCLCIAVLCTIIMVHKDTSSSYRSVNCIGL